MGGPGSGGHNALHSIPAAGLNPGRWPWERRRKGSKPWSADRIRRRIEKTFAEAGIVTSATARDLVGALADAHHVLQICRDAIRDHPATPMVGKRDAYAAQAVAHGDIRRALTALGALPKRAAGARTELPGSKSAPGKVSADDFAPPTA